MYCLLLITISWHASQGFPFSLTAFRNCSSSRKACDVQLSEMPLAPRLSAVVVCSRKKGVRRTGVGQNKALWQGFDRNGVFLYSLPAR